jgi:hypothetical protein
VEVGRSGISWASVLVAVEENPHMKRKRRATCGPPVQSKGSDPQRLKPLVDWRSTARLKPCPFKEGTLTYEAPSAHPRHSQPIQGTPTYKAPSAHSEM